MAFNWTVVIAHSNELCYSMIYTSCMGDNMLSDSLPSVNYSQSIWH